jgi:hypothetical protein
MKWRLWRWRWQSEDRPGYLSGPRRKEPRSAAERLLALETKFLLFWVGQERDSVLLRYPAPAGKSAMSPSDDSVASSLPGPDLPSKRRCRRGAAGVPLVVAAFGPRQKTTKHTEERQRRQRVTEAGNGDSALHPPERLFIGTRPGEQSGGGTLNPGGRNARSTGSLTRGLRPQRDCHRSSDLQNV